MFAVKIMNINQRYQRFMKFQLKNKKLSMAAVFFNLWLSLFTSPPAACVSRWPIWSCWGPDTWGLGNSYHLLLGLVSLVIVAQHGLLARWGEARASCSAISSCSTTMSVARSRLRNALKAYSCCALDTVTNICRANSCTSSLSFSSRAALCPMDNPPTWRTQGRDGEEVFGARSLGFSRSQQTAHPSLLVAGMLEVPVTEKGRGLRL